MSKPGPGRPKGYKPPFKKRVRKALPPIDLTRREYESEDTKDSESINVSTEPSEVRQDDGVIFNSHIDTTSTQSFEVEGNRNKIAKLLCQNKTLFEIATELSLPYEYVKNTKSNLVRGFVRETKEYTRQALELELVKINNLEQQYWVAWERSLEVEKIVTEGSNGKGTFDSTTEKKSFGDPRYLAGIQWCIEQRTKLMKLADPDIHLHANQTNNFIMGSQNTELLIKAMNAIASGHAQPVEKAEPEEVVDVTVN